MKKSKLVACSCGFVACAAGAFTLEDQSGNKYEIGGFAKMEWSKAGQSPKVVPDNLSTFTIDNRNTLDPNDLNQAAGGPPSRFTEGSKSSQLGMQQLTLGVSREMDSALGLEAKVTYRWRSASASEIFLSPDVDYTRGPGLGGHDFTEKLVGINRPDLGALRVGTQLSRSWSRSDSFSYPVGMSSQWADSGAGFGVLPQAVRLTSPIFEDGTGKLSGEFTWARNERNTNNVDQSLVQRGSNPTRPDLKELFFQYSNQKNLIELVIQSTSGAKQTAFGKSALVGWIGDPDNLFGSNQPRRAMKPSQSVVILQGNHWPNPQNMMTWGLRKSQWSGSAATCNYNAQLVLDNGDVGGCVFGIEPGFNYGVQAESFSGYRASSWDAMLGWSHYVGLYTYTLSGVFFGTASTENRNVEWGQSNSALSVNLGVSRKVPEVHKGLTVSGGVAFAKFKRLGPAPLSMPNNSFLGINSLYDKSGHSMSLGATWVF